MQQVTHTDRFLTEADILVIAERAHVNSAEQAKFKQFLSYIAAPDSGEPLTEDLLVNICPWCFVPIMAHLCRTSEMYSERHFQEVGIKVSAVVFRSLQLAIAKSLSDLIAQAAQLDFEIERMLSRDVLGITEVPSSFSRTYHATWPTVLRRLALAYPMLVRYIFTTVVDLTHHTAELSDRFASDYRDLAAMLGVDDPGQIEEMEYGLSDPHNSGRTVTKLRTTLGSVVYYKPRSLESDEATSVLLDYVTELLPRLSLATPAFLGRETYGWSASVVPTQSLTGTEARNHLFSLGALTYLVWITAGVDFHLENIIISADQIFLIDTETIFHPPLLLYNADLFPTPTSILNRTILRSGVLPRWISCKPQGEVVDVSCLGYTRGAATSRSQGRWYDDEERRPQFKREPLRLLNENPQLVHELNQPEMASAFNEGFFMMSAALANKLSDVFAKYIKPASEKRLGRRILRDTSFYAGLLDETRSLDCLSSFEKTLAVLRALQWEVVEEMQCYTLEPFYEREKDALLRRDIPYFRRSQFPKDMESQVSLPSIMQITSEETLGFNGALAKATIDARIGRLYAPELPQTITGEENSEKGFLLSARAIADELLSSSFSSTGGNRYFVGLEQIPEESLAQVSPFEWDLYGGVTGMLMFLAALGTATGDNAYERIVHESVTSLTSLLGRRIPRGGCFNRLGISGLGGILFALGDITERIGSKLAGGLAASICEDISRKINEDSNLDFIGGAAGAIVGLLKWYQLTGNSRYKDVAQRCGRHILDCRSGTSGGHLVWRTINGRHLTGFSHGTSGIAFSLLRLHEISYDKALLQAVEDSVRYENEMFSELESNWPDLRADSSQKMYGRSWCHGAPGIALSRMAMIRSGVVSASNTELLKSLELICNIEPESDGLCCGTSGIAEILNIASQVLGDESYMQRARQLATGIQQRSNNLKTADPTIGMGRRPLGLFQGIPGIGYCLLRLAEPRLLCSLLLWE